MDEIRIRDLQVFAHHGVFPEETQNGQNFYINATLYLDTQRAGWSDELEQSVSYADVCMFMNAYMKEHTYKLLEAIAEHMTRDLLIEFPLLREVSLEICKPEAPIPLPFESVSVSIHRKWNHVFVALGSNMGEKERTIEEAVEALQENLDCKDIKVSKLINTTPYGGVEQDNFVNGVLEMWTLLSPLDLLDLLQDLEQQAKRERKVHWGPRTLDLDILFYNDEIIYNERLIVPHIDMQNRDFVMEPMVELNPYWMHPVFHKSVLEMNQELKNTKEQHIIF